MLSCKISSTWIITQLPAVNMVIFGFLHYYIIRCLEAKVQTRLLSGLVCVCSVYSVVFKRKSKRCYLIHRGSMIIFFFALKNVLSIGVSDD